MDDFVDFFAVLVVLVIIAIGIALFVRLVSGVEDSIDERYNSYRANCFDAGGEIYEPDAIALCLSQDGSVIKVYP